MKRNTQFKIINGVFIVFLLSLAYLLFLKEGKPQAQQSKQKVLKTETDESIKQVSDDNDNEDTSLALGIVPSQSEKQADQNLKKPAFTAEQISKLNVFRELHSKVLLTKEEKNNLKQLISDKSFILEIGESYLKSSSTDFVDKLDLQTDVNNYLLLALKDGDHETSRDMVKNIILDNQVEDPNRSLSERKVLAEEKAEIIFHALALYPDEFKFSKNDIPGPVTQKILENAKAIHKENEELSRAEFVKLSQK